MSTPFADATPYKNKFPSCYSSESDSFGDRRAALLLYSADAQTKSDGESALDVQIQPLVFSDLGHT